MGRIFILTWTLACVLAAQQPTPDFLPVTYRNPGLAVDLGVGLWAWPLPMDVDGDGDLDLVVACPDTPFNGTYWFENPGGSAFPVFRPPRRLDSGRANVRVSRLDGRLVMSTPWQLFSAFGGKGYGPATRIPIEGAIWEKDVRARANQWQFADLTGDGLEDLVVGIGDWHEYGWDNAFDAQGHWTRGPLHGHVYLVANVGEKGKPRFAGATKLAAGAAPLDVYGMPSPCVADFDGDGDLDLICGDFVDSLTYFANTGTTTHPRFAAGQKLPFRMHLCMIVPTPVDWDGDGDTDLVVGQEDGRVALIEHTGRLADGIPVFKPPRFFQQQAERLKFGALATPHAVDWDGDGDEDLICGNTAGEIAFIENLDGGNPPRWGAPQLLHAGGQPFRVIAGPNGSIQGPAEAKWGYTTVTVADWDHDGKLDVLGNSIWGRVFWLRNPGPKGTVKLEAPRAIKVAWPGQPPKPSWNWWDPEPTELATQWRTTPYAIDWNRDGLTDLVMLDHEGYLAVFRRERRQGRLVLLPGERFILGPDRKPLRLNGRLAGASGRRKLCFADWDGDGRLDLLLNSRNVEFWRNVGTGKEVVFQNHGHVAPRKLAGHTSSPTVVDWNRDGKPELLVGAEDGHFYYLPGFQTPNDPPAGPPATHLVAAWDFAGRNPLADKAPAGKHQDTLTARGAAKVADGVAQIPRNPASLFEAASSADLEFGGEFTIWMRLRVGNAPASFQSLVDKRHFVKPQERSYGVFLPPVREGGGVGIGGQVSQNGTGVAITRMRSKPCLPVGEWCEVALVLRRVGAFLQAEWYAGEDGKLGLLPTGDRMGVLAVFQSKQPLLIGNDANRKPGRADLEFEEIRLYNRALTVGELREVAGK
jgi:hypothetical protein